MIYISKVKMSIFSMLIIIILILTHSGQSESSSLSLDPKCTEKWPDCNINGIIYVNAACERKGCGPKFKECIELPPDAEFRQAVLDKHNELRNKLASGEDTRGSNEAASNMMALSYDLRLEYTAICHVHGCEMTHDKCRINPDFSTAGQNLAKRKVSMFKTVTQKDVDKEASLEVFKLLVGKWYEEIALRDYKSAIDSFTFVHGTGHFTALIWATTTHVGCARAVHRSKQDEFIIHLTCNYAPSGNVLTLPMYTKGAACSNCPTGISCNTKYTSLCGEIDVKDINTGENPYRSADIARGGQKITYSHIMPFHYLIFLFIVVLKI